MKDLMGEKAALEQTKKIVDGIPANVLPKKQYRELVGTIYDKQLKKFTKYNRSQRHLMIKKLFRSKDAK